MGTISLALNRYHGLSEEEANQMVYIVDDRGCISKGRDNLAEMKETFHKLDQFESRDESMEGLSLHETIKKVRPSILIGLCLWRTLHQGNSPNDG